MIIVMVIIRIIVDKKVLKLTHRDHVALGAFKGEFGREVSVLGGIHYMY